MTIVARSFIQDLEEKTHGIIIPAPAMAEFLVPVPPEKTVPIVEQISQSFKVVPFDLAVAEKYASLGHTVHKSEKPSPKVKLDLMII